MQFGQMHKSKIACCARGLAQCPILDNRLHFFYQSEACSPMQIPMNLLDTVCIALWKGSMVPALLSTHALQAGRSTWCRACTITPGNAQDLPTDRCCSWVLGKWGIRGACTSWWCSCSSCLVSKATKQPSHDGSLHNQCERLQQRLDS